MGGFFLKEKTRKKQLTEAEEDLSKTMGNIESVDGQSEMMKHHIMPLKVPMPDPNELEEKFAIVLVSFASTFFFSPFHSLSSHRPSERKCNIVLLSELPLRHAPR